MDRKFNGEWSASEIEMVKSLIHSHNPNNNYSDATNKNHDDIVNHIQVRFPWKERHQVIGLYIDLVADTMSQSQSGNHSVVETKNLVNGNSKIPMGDPSIDNMALSFAHVTDKAPKAMRNKGSFWTKEEHR
jgi:hypothetical protein